MNHRVSHSHQETESNESLGRIENYSFLAPSVFSEIGKRARRNRAGFFVSSFEGHYGYSRHITLAENRHLPAYDALHFVIGGRVYERPREVHHERHASEAEVAAVDIVSGQALYVDVREGRVQSVVSKTDIVKKGFARPQTRFLVFIAFFSSLYWVK